MTGRRKKLKIVSGITAGLILLGVLAVLILPWKIGVGNRLTQMLEAKGFTGVKLTLADIGLQRATLTDISIGAETPLILKTLDIDYSLRDLMRGDLRGVTLRGLALEAAKKNEKWFVIGLENMKGAADASKTFALPVRHEDFAMLPFDVLNVEDSSLHVASEAWQVSLPLTVTLDKSAEPKLVYSAGHITGKVNDINIATGKAAVQAQVDPAAKEWQGTWSVDDIALSRANTDIPPMQGKGGVTANAGKVLVKGVFKSADGAYTVNFSLDERLNGEPSSVTIVSAQMPWKGGQISLRNEKIPLSGSKAIRLDLHVSGIDVNDLMQALTGKRVSATGSFSGTIPVVIGKDGSLSFPQGGLNTQGPGTISMPADAIPGTGEKLDLVRKILENFQYAKFNLGINGINGKGLSMVLALEGNNPAVENGRMVKLNVNLTGDLLDFIKQNAMLFNDPKGLLKQSNDDKKN